MLTVPSSYASGLIRRGTTGTTNIRTKAGADEVLTHSICKVLQLLREYRAWILLAIVHLGRSG